jgi:hypothetical protein
MAQPPVRANAKTLSIETEGALRGRYHCRVPVEHTAAIVGAPAYFGDEATRTKLREGDRIEVEPDDLSWFGELIVRAVVPAAREVVTRWVVGPVHFDAPPIDAGDYRIEYKGKVQKHCIYLGDQIIEAGFETREKAHARLTYLRADVAA